MNTACVSRYECHFDAIEAITGSFDEIEAITGSPDAIVGFNNK
jgi:hypothetical protein